MATILEFQRSTRKPKAEPPMRGLGHCEVVLFPGVRHERWADTPRREHGCGRDRLDLDN